MTLEQILAFLPRVRYRPGWVLTGLIQRDPRRPGENGSILISVLAEVADSHHPDRTITIASQRRFYRGQVRNEAELARYLFELIQRIEEHESREWFRVDERVVFDPHRLDGPAAPATPTRRENA